MHDENIFLTPAAFEREYNLSRKTYFRWIRSGKLTAYKPSPKTTVVKRDQVEGLLGNPRINPKIDRGVEETIAELQRASMSAEKLSVDLSGKSMLGEDWKAVIVEEKTPEP